MRIFGRAGQRQNRDILNDDRTPRRGYALWMQLHEQIRFPSVDSSTASLAVLEQRPDKSYLGRPDTKFQPEILQNEMTVNPDPCADG